MQKDTTLNLLVIDDDQLYAERLVKLLSAYYTDINLGLLDDRQKLLKSLRQQWDVLIFGKAYDLVFTDVVDIVQKKNIDLPLLCLMSDDIANTSRNEEGLPAVLDSTMIKALVADKESAIIIAIRLQHDHLMTRRQLNKLNNLLAQAEQRANILIKNSKSAVAYIDQGVHIFANDAYLQLFGFESVAEIIGIPVIDLIANGNNVQAFKQFLRQFDRDNREQVEFRFKSRHADGSHFEAQLQLAMASLDAEPMTQIIIQQNNSSSAEITKRLVEAQRHDSLTGLSNRLAFEEHFDILYKQVLAGKMNAGLFFIGLDNIGKISLSLGLQGIDITIQKVADRLNELVTDSYISRFNDTSFAILVEKVTTQELQDLAERIRLHISEMLIEIGQRTTNTTASIAVMAIEKNAPKPQLLLERALEVINHIRIESVNQGNAYHLYNPMEHADSDDSALAETLMKALTQDRFELMFQPIYDINDDCSDFFEVYLRLPLADAQNTILMPDDFMTVAKKHNLREKIDRWVLINACKQLNAVRKSHPQSSILVPLTSASLVDKNLMKVASQLIKAVGGTSGSLTIQFDECDVANHLTIAKTQFAALNQVSCQVAIQHFGISAKSLEISQLVKPNLVRLAKSYVDGIDDSDNLQTVKSLITQANNFNVDVLMPYIEDAATMSIAWSIGARYLQGYYLEEASNTINAM
ncbi:EAL domain-containing protein [Psychrobacter sp. TAE2020]|uniref:EAL domain-containing protein n=1 Tax=Psychrobacter sp. TAE2020 TaxID=2846762 RepID=UPI001C1071E4|nr:GGDEF domain-containing phosphodiesterase [Psychrobacter sp. TAE2020]MBU5618041.1 EAL domain-containing protein [Psychrobacter sp. TAE2020]